MGLSIEQGLVLVRKLAGENLSLATLVTTSDSPDPQVSVVNAAVIDHPITGSPVVALVGRPGAKLRNMRDNRRATLLFRSGWQWVAVRGAVELSGPDDPNPAIDQDQQRQLLRAVYEAAGGSHPDLEEYDREMIRDRRCAVLLAPDHIWSNPPESEHKEPEEV